MSPEETAPPPAKAAKQRKSRLGLYLLFAAWVGAGGLVIAQIVAPIA